MIRYTAAVVVLLSAFTIRADGQAPVAAPDSEYMLVNRYSDKDVAAAARDGYAVLDVPQSLATHDILLKRDGGPRFYRFVSTSGLKSFVKGLNEAAAADATTRGLVRVGMLTLETLAGNQKPAFLLEGIECAPPPVPSRHGRARIAGGRRGRLPYQRHPEP